MVSFRENIHRVNNMFDTEVFIARDNFGNILPGVFGKEIKFIKKLLESHGETHNWFINVFHRLNDDGAYDITELKILDRIYLFYEKMYLCCGLDDLKGNQGFTCNPYGKIHRIDEATDMEGNLLGIELKIQDIEFGIGSPNLTLPPKESLEYPVLSQQLKNIIQFIVGK